MSMPPDLVVVVRSATRPTVAMQAAATNPDRALVRRRLTPFLHLLLARDLPDRTAYVNKEQLDSWGVDPLEAWMHGAGVLDPSAGLEQLDDQVWGMACDAYSSSRLILPRWLQAFRDTVGDEPLAAVPHGGRVLVAGREHAHALLARAGREYDHASIPVSPALYTASALGEVRPWVPDPDHPARAAQRAAFARLAQTEYQRQASILADLYESPRFVPIATREARDGTLLTVAHWRETDGPSVLPDADVTVLTPATGSPLAVATGLLVQRLGLREWPELHPRRWQAPRWPDAATWTGLMG